MRVILALDLGTTTGFAIGGSGHVVSGTWSFKPQRFEGGGMRYLRFLKKLKEVCDASRPDIIYFEEVRRHRGTDAAHVYGGLMGVLTAFCEGKGIPYSGVPVGEIKKFWCQKGNADKDMMIAEARRRGFTPIDDNEADALALFHLKVEEHGENLESESDERAREVRPVAAKEAVAA